MSQSSQSSFVQELQRYSTYLRLLAELQLGNELKGRVDLSGLVQQTLLEACQAPQLPAESSPRLRAWLREALTNNLQDEIKRVRREKRDVRREIRLSDLESSSLRLEALVAGVSVPPEAGILQEERVLQLTQALDRLPPGQREAIVLHHINQLPVTEVARLLDRSPVAVAGLLKRGFKSLRELLRRHEDTG